MTRLGIAAAFCALFWATAPATAATTATGSDTLPSSLPMPEGTATRPPLAHALLCRAEPAACAADKTQPLGDRPRVVLTDEAWRDLVRVNAAVNRRIRPRDDRLEHGRADVWSIDPRTGDCEDYALTKRAELMARGWSAAALLVAVVRDGNGRHHAVLVARTDRGDFVLDNLARMVRPWTDLAYRWIKRQSTADPRRWVALDGYTAEMVERRDERLRRLAARD
jgi:predicted transglutaminase-like cysteine proteinase